MIHIHSFVTVCLSLGLTVTITRDAGTGDYALEAGALVLADQGIKKEYTTDLKCAFVSVSYYPHTLYAYYRNLYHIRCFFFL